MYKIISIIGLCFVLMGFDCHTQPPDVCTPGETQSCVCPSGDLGSQTCSYSGDRWGGCSCRSSIPDAGVSPSCKPSGYTILGCGCWGPAFEGQIRTATGCCSNQAFSTSRGCVGFCSAGGVPWGNVCL